ncbi:MAG: hypothetical protein PVF68_16065 [Acidobacteriota bacterium]|jgi:hypothetical protein
MREPSGRPRAATKARVSYLLAIVALGLAALDAFGTGDPILVALSVAVIALNVVAFRRARDPAAPPSVAIHLGNAALSLWLAYRLFLEGKRYIQYAYLLAGVAFLAVSIVAAFRRVRRRGGGTGGPGGL